MPQEFLLHPSPIRKTKIDVPTPVPGYGEGIWTPTLQMNDNANDFAVTYNTQVGRYLLIGRFITLHFHIVTSSFTHTTASSNLYIEGIPYNVADYAIASGTGHCDFQGITAAGYTQLGVVASQNQTRLTFLLSGSGQTQKALTSFDMPSGGNVRLWGNVSYRIAL